jgi:hypothetical protein
MRIKVNASGKTVDIRGVTVGDGSELGTIVYALRFVAISKESSTENRLDCMELLTEIRRGWAE